MNPNMMEDNTSCSDRHETAATTGAGTTETMLESSSSVLLERTDSHGTARVTAAATIMPEFHVPTTTGIESSGRSSISSGSDAVVSSKDPRATWGIVKLLQQDGSGATQDTSGTWSTTSDRQLVLVNDAVVVDDDEDDDNEDEDGDEHVGGNDNKDNEEKMDGMDDERDLNEEEPAVADVIVVEHEVVDAQQVAAAAEEETEKGDEEIDDEAVRPQGERNQEAEPRVSYWRKNNQDGNNQHQTRQMTLEEIMEEEENERQRRLRQEEIAVAAATITAADTSNDAAETANNNTTPGAQQEFALGEEEDEDERMLRFALEVSLREFNSSQSALMVSHSQLEADEFLASLLEEEDTDQPQQQQQQQQRSSPRSPPFQREVEVTEKIIGTPHSEQRTMPHSTTFVQSIPRLPLHRADSNPTPSTTPAITTTSTTPTTTLESTSSSAGASVSTSTSGVAFPSLPRRDVEKTETIIETPHDDRRRRRSAASTAWNGSRRSLLRSGSWKSQRVGNSAWSESTQQQHPSQQHQVPMQQQQQQLNPPTLQQQVPLQQQQQQQQQLPSTPQTQPQLQPPSTPKIPSNSSSHVCDRTLLEAARQHLSPREVEEIEKALREADLTSSIGSSSLQDSQQSSLTAHSEHSHSSQNQYSQNPPTTPLQQPQSLAGDTTSSLANATPSLSASAIMSSASELERHLLSEEDVLLMASASHHLSAEDAAAIQRALQEVEEQQRLLHVQQQEQRLLQQLQSEPLTDQSYYGIQAPVTAEEEAAIQRALKEADEEEESKSLQLALLIHEEETRQRQQQQQVTRVTGNVRTMTRAELAAEQNPPLATTSSPGARAPHAVGAFYSSSPPRRRHPLEEEEEQRRQYQQQSPSSGQRQQQQQQQRRLFDEMLHATAGFRINSNSPSQQHQQWARIDRNSIVGPNREVRTKHDTLFQGQANAQRLGLDMFDDETTTRTLVGNKAYNSFLQSTKQRNMTKGVASHGVGRANSDTEATKGGAMDSRVRLQISRAINNGLIEKCNGVVKEGKEAIIYHADHGAESGGYDVAVKVFKRIQEFRSRVDYAEGDPRYTQKSSFRHASSDASASDASSLAPLRGGDPRFTRKASFRNASDREQLELWAEKEYRNLIRANRARVPVPTPLLHKENVLYMRFLGTDGWPSPQLREISLKKGSTKWLALYLQIMRAVRRLYHGAQLIHGDLSEYNIMVVPAHLVENKDSSIEDEQIEVQAVLIDFGQAVVKQHPEALNLLRRDLEMVRSFFIRQGIQVMDEEQALAFVLDPDGMIEESGGSEDASEAVTG